MFRHLEFLLGELKLGLSAFELFAVVAGPGSFTGLRVGLTAVKGWAEVYQRPIVAVSGLEAVAAQASSATTYLAAVLDARRGQVYTAGYERVDGALVVRAPECVLSLEEFLSLVRQEVATSDLTFVTPTPEILRAPLAKYGFAEAPICEVSAVLAPVVGRLGLERAARGQVVSALELDANYVRRSDAELLWKGR